MYDHIPVIENEPTFLCLPFHAAFFLVVLLGGFGYGFRERVEHTVTGAVADHEVVGKRRDVLDIEQQDVFALFVLQGGDDFMSKFECVQRSPLYNS